MQIGTRTYSSELPALFRRLFEIVPKDQWRRRASELRIREQKNPFLTAYFDDQFPIERALMRALSSHKERGRYPQIDSVLDTEFYELYSFVSTLVRVHQRLSPAARHRLRGCLRDGLTTEKGLTSLALEMSVAVHLWNGGYDVEFTDLENRAQFDFLARKNGVELEVDCKTASGDVGRAIHRLRALDLFHRIQPTIRDVLLAKQGGRAMRIQIPAALHGREEYIQGLTALIIEGAREGVSLSADGVGKVSLSEFELDQGPFQKEREPTREELGQLMVGLFGTANPNAISLHRPREAAVVAMIESEKPDKVVDGVYRSLKDSAQRQFTGQRPALLAVRLTDLTKAHLEELAGQDRNGLAAIANRLFAGETRQHLYGLAFFARAGALSSVTPSADVPLTVLENRGSTVLFRRDAHPMASDPRLNVLRLFSS